MGEELYCFRFICIYAHSFDDDRKLIAQEMDSGFFDKVTDDTEASVLDDATLAKLKVLIKQNPELIRDLIRQNRFDA